MMALVQIQHVYFVFNGFKIGLLIELFMIYNIKYENRRIRIRKYDDM